MNKKATSMSSQTCQLHPRACLSELRDKGKAHRGSINPLVLILSGVMLAFLLLVGTVFMLLRNAEQARWDIVLHRDTCIALAAQGVALREIADGAQCALVGRYRGEDWSGHRAKIEVEVGGAPQTFSVLAKEIVSRRQL